MSFCDLSIWTGKIIKLAHISIMFIVCLVACNPRKLPYIREKLERNDRETTRTTEEIIRQTPKLKELSDICENASFIGNLEILKKSLNRRTENTLFFYYHSQTDTKEFMHLDQVEFAKKNWQLVKAEDRIGAKQVTFRNNDYEITVNYGVDGDYNIYSRACVELISN